MLKAVAEILQIGAAGFLFLMAYLNFTLLRDLIRQKEINSAIVLLVKRFMNINILFGVIAISLTLISTFTVNEKNKSLEQLNKAKASALEEIQSSTAKEIAKARRQITIREKNTTSNGNQNNQLPVNDIRCDVDERSVSINMIEPELIKTVPKNIYKINGKIEQDNSSVSGDELRKCGIVLFAYGSVYGDATYRSIHPLEVDSSGKITGNFALTPGFKTKIFIMGTNENGNTSIRSGNSFDVM